MSQKAPRTDDLCCRRHRSAGPSAWSRPALSDAVESAAPAAQLLLAVLAPWDRARLRLVCHALAAAVPARSCAPTLAAMVRAPDGGAALLRYGAGDARPRWVHALVAVEADAADALRWMLGMRPDWPQIRRLQELALRWGSAASWHVLRPMASATSCLAEASALLNDALAGRSVALVAECAATAAALVARAATPAGLDDDEARPLACALYAARPADVAVAAATPFLRPDVGRALGREARLVALRAGHRALAEPYDWVDAADGRLRLLFAALRGGDLGLAQEAREAHGAPLLAFEQHLCATSALMAPRNLVAAVRWVTCTMGFDGGDTESPVQQEILLRCDAVDGLCYLVQRTGIRPADAMLHEACLHGAAACVRYLVDDVGLVPTRDMLLDTLLAGHYDALAALAAHAAPLGVAELVDLLGQSKMSEEGRVVRAVAALRRHALLPPPGPELARALLAMWPSQPALEYVAAAATGHPVDADHRAWMDADERTWDDFAAAAVTGPTRDLCASWLCPRRDDAPSDVRVAT